MFFAWVFCVPGFAGVGDHDSRFYVDNQMWATEPYKNFVHLHGWLSNVGSSCTAQYVSKNIIVSAGHCLKDNARYEAQNYAGKKIDLMLLETGYRGILEENGDWAVFLVKDPQYYSDSFFNMKVPNVENTSIDVLNAGWGFVRVLEDWEIQKIQEILPTIDSRLDRQAFFRALDEKLSEANISPIRETMVQSLKASECMVSSHRYNNVSSDVLPSTCDSWQGNSGGGYVAKGGNDLYGVCSFGPADVAIEFSESSDNRAFLASSKQFLNVVNKYIDEFSNPEYTACFVLGRKWERNTCKCQGAETWDNVNYKCVPAEGTSPSDGSNTNSSTPDNSNGNPSSSTPGDNNSSSNDNPDNTADDENGITEGTGVVTAKAIDDLTRDVDDLEKRIDKKRAKISSGATKKDVFDIIDNWADYEIKTEQLEQLKKAYEEAKAKEQSMGNKLLTAATVAATGLGMMELMMGKAEQKADADAEQDMAAYMATMRCTYAGGKSVKAGPEEVELPGGNDGKLMSYRSEYIALAKSLKERKTAMDMLPGIESEEILDKAEMGLYDDENKGIESGTYASLYRAKIGSEEDQKKIDADKEKSEKRVKYGAIAAAGGTALGIGGDSLINGKLGELIKNRKDKKSGNKTDDDVVKQLKEGLSSAGMTNVDKLDFSNLDLSGLKDKIGNVDFASMSSSLKGKDASQLLNTSNAEGFTSSFGSMLGNGGGLDGLFGN